MPANLGLRPFVAVPKDIREWTKWMRDQVLSADDDSVATVTIQDEAVTYAKIQDVTADRILGRLTTDGVVTELTAAQVFAFIITQQADITDASVAHSLNPTFDNNDVEAKLDALGAKINLILDALDAVGITA